MAKKKQQLWFGYLEAGRRSSAVVRDGSIDTGRASTIYLYNLAKGKILEYQRDIVEPKLRQLDAGDAELEGELSAAYLQAREAFVPRGSLRPKPVRRSRPKPVELELPDFDDEGEDVWVPLDDDAADQTGAEYAD